MLDSSYLPDLTHVVAIFAYPNSPVSLFQKKFSTSISQNPLYGNCLKFHFKQHVNFYFIFNMSVLSSNLEYQQLLVLILVQIRAMNVIKIYRGLHMWCSYDIQKIEIKCSNIIGIKSAYQMARDKVHHCCSFKF